MPLNKWIDIPPVWLVGCLCLAWWSTAWAGMWFAPPNGALALGWALIIGGISLMVLAVHQFRRHKTTPIPHHVPDALITTGVFRWSRNPIYLGDAMVLAGLSLIWGSWLGLALIPAFVAVITVRFVKPEEARLSEHFSSGFQQSTASTRRWL
jgi:protein-S-isoprenylcysteine O-methyltransferase Ste14